MNYYSFHIGDYIKQTVHLTPMEDICYRRLIDMYYETEQPIPKETDRVSRRLRLDTELVDSVLSEFFTLTENGWVNERCEAEISAYHVKADTARSNGKLGGRPKKTQPVIDRNPTESGSKANHEPITNNHEPVLKPKAPAAPLPDWLQPEAWEDFTQHRKSLKSAMTPKAQTLLILELTKLRAQGHDPTEVIKQSIMRGWKGFFALSQNGNGQTKEKNYYERLAEHTAILTGQHKRKPADDPTVIHGTAERVD